MFVGVLPLWERSRETNVFEINNLRMTRRIGILSTSLLLLSLQIVTIRNLGRIDSDFVIESES